MKHFLRVEVISDGSIQDTKEFGKKELSRMFTALDSYCAEIDDKKELNQVMRLKHKVRNLLERLEEEMESK